MPAHKLIHISHDEWLKEYERRYGRSLEAGRFVCPCCDHIQSGADFIAVGLNREETSKVLAFSCIGRWTPSPRSAFAKDGSGPCNYAGGGLFRVAPIAVDIGEDEPRFTFDFADDPLAAQAAAVA